MISPLNLLQNEANVIQINTLSSCFSMGAEMFLITAIDQGITGPVVAIVGFNAIFVSILTWAINGIALAPV